MQQVRCCNVSIEGSTMKSTFGIGVLLVVPLLTVSACHSAARQQSLNAAVARESTAGLEACRAQIDATLAALNQLAIAQPAQLPSAYEQYSKQVEKMNAAARTADKQAKAVRGESLDYWAMWQESYNHIENDQLRNASDLRRTAVMGRFDSIQKSYEAARAAFVPFMRNLELIRRVLGNDLTPGGLQKLATTDVVKLANTHGVEMARNLDAMKLQYTALAEALRPATAGEAAGPPTAAPPFARGKQ
jgi:hypothetical protein